MLTVPSGTALTFARNADNISNTTGLSVPLYFDLQPGSVRGQLTHNLTLGAGSNIEMDVPICGTFYTRVGTAGQPTATESTIFALSGTGGNSTLNYSKASQSLVLTTPGGTVSAALATPVVASITEASLTNNVATIKTSAPHGFGSNAPVTISGVNATFNGTYTVTSVPTPNTFTFAKTNVDVPLQTGLSGTASYSGINLEVGDVVWIAWAIYRDNLILKFSVNDGPISTNESGSNTAPTVTFSRLHLGHDQNIEKHWEGMIEQFLIYDVPISNTEFDSMKAKTTPTTMGDDSRIAFATITTENNNQFWISYQRAKDLVYRWDGTWRNADIRARITNNSTNDGKAFNTVDMVAVQKDTDWFKSGGSSSWPQSRVWSTAFIKADNSSTFYYAPFYCMNPDYPDWSLWEVFDMVEIPGIQTMQYVMPRWSHGSDERDFYYLPEMTSLRAHPRSQQTFGYIQ